LILSVPFLFILISLEGVDKMFVVILSLFFLLFEKFFLIFLHFFDCSFPLAVIVGPHPKILILFFSIQIKLILRLLDCKFNIILLDWKCLDLRYACLRTTIDLEVVYGSWWNLLRSFLGERYLLSKELLFQGFERVQSDKTNLLIPA